MSNKSLESLLNETTEGIGIDKALRTIVRRPATVTIYNGSTTDANWKEAASGLSGVLAWKLQEKNGNTFYYCFNGVGTTYMTSFGPIQRDMEITAIYIKRTSATDIDYELEVWTA